MPPSVHNRRFERHLHETPIMFTCGTDHPYCYYGARMYNHSIGGIYFESKYALEPGSIICFNRAAGSPEDFMPDMYKSHRVQVKWCREISSEQGIYYGIGVAYVNPLSPNGVDPLEVKSAPHPVVREDSGTGANGQALDIPEDREMTQTERILKQAVESAEERAHELLTLNRFVTSVSSTLDMDTMLKSVCREMTAVFGARNTGIGLLDRKRSKVTMVAFYAADPEESDATGMSIPLRGNAATHRVVQTGHPIVVPDVQNNPLTASIHDIARKRGTECLMIVPLMTRGEVIGTIGLPTSDKNRVFTSGDVAMAQTLASQIASAIDNARLFARTEKAREIAEHDLEIGRKIQTEFFPENLPELPGWEFVAHFRPARLVTGDFYDFFMLGEDNRIGFVIADVCDHGVGSALFMVLFRSLIRAFAEQNFKHIRPNGRPDSSQAGRALQKTITETNDYIARMHGKSGMFATIFFGVLDPRTGMLDYVNGGHEAPVIVGHKGIKTRLKPTGPAVGLFQDLEFAAEQIRIDTEDTLFAYTDGVSDARNPEGESFTKDRLFAIVNRPVHAARILIDNINRIIDYHIAEVDQNDDVTMIAIRRLDSGPLPL